VRNYIAGWVLKICSTTMMMTTTLVNGHFPGQPR